MSALSIQPTYPIFTDIDGQPLEDGYVWIGTANLDPQTNPINVYWDAALTLPAAQPIRTLAGYPANSGTPARLYVNSDYSIRVMNKNGSAVYSAPVATERYSGIVVQIDASDVSFTQSGAGAVDTTVEEKLRTGVDVSVFDFMTSAEIASVQAYSFGLDVTTAVQAAIDAAFANKQNLYIPAGGYLVTGLTLPGDYPNVDQRDEAFRLYGQGYGIAFSNLNTGGTVIKSITDAPILTDRVITPPNAHVNYEIDHIRFDGSSTTPVVLFNGIYGQSSFHHNVIYQRSTGDGLKILYSATAHIYENYSYNKDFVTPIIGAGRTGVGFNYPLAYTSGLVTFSKNTSRGWLTGYYIGGGAGSPLSTGLYDCESSTVYNGIIIGSTADKTIVSGHYFEGGDGGIGVKNDGKYTTIRDSAMYAGFSKGIEDISTTNSGTTITANVISIGAVPNAIGIDIASSAPFGGNDKTVFSNFISYTIGTAGVSGLKISGTDPRISHWGNMYNPRGGWTGAGTKEINDTSSNGVFGIAEAFIGQRKVPVLSRGAVYLQEGASALTEANVAANVLSVPEGSYYLCSASSAATVNRLSLNNTTQNRLLTFRTTTANMTFSDSAYMQLAGGASFTGPGTITFIVDYTGGANYAYEISRTVF